LYLGPFVARHLTNGSVELARVERKKAPDTVRGPVHREAEAQRLRPLAGRDRAADLPLLGALFFAARLGDDARPALAPARRLAAAVFPLDRCFAGADFGEDFAAALVDGFAVRLAAGRAAAVLPALAVGGCFAALVAAACLAGLAATGAFGFAAAALAGAAAAAPAAAAVLADVLPFGRPPFRANWASANILRNAS
jgi:hypothetical protein